MIKKILTYHKEDSLVRDGFILFTATILANAAAYVYHFYMGRVLGPADYSVLGVILSLLYLINVPVNVIQMTITKFVAQYNITKKKDVIHLLYQRSLHRLFFVGCIIFLLFLAVSYPLAHFLYIPITALLVFSPIVIFALLLPVTRGLLQGLQSFKKLGVNMVLESFSKLLIGVILVFLGFHINGAISGLVLSFALAFFVLYYNFRPSLVHSRKTMHDFQTKEVYKYATPVFISLFALTLFYSIDVILVKHYFSELQTGYYAAASLIGKIIFFGTYSLGVVMFPKVAEMHTLQKDNKHLLSKSLAFMAAGAGVLLLVYFLFPRFIILPLFGMSYLPILPLIGPFGVMMTFFSFNYLLSLYNLSIQRTRFIRILFVFNLLEILFLTFYHTSLLQIVWGLSFLMIALFILLFTYTYHNHATKTHDHHSRV